MFLIIIAIISLILYSKRKNTIISHMVEINNLYCCCKNVPILSIDDVLSKNQSIKNANKMKFVKIISIIQRKV